MRRGLHQTCKENTVVFLFMLCLPRSLLPIVLENYPHSCQHDLNHLWSIELMPLTLCRCTLEVHWVLIPSALQACIQASPLTRRTSVLVAVARHMGEMHHKSPLLRSGCRSPSGHTVSLCSGSRVSPWDPLVFAHLQFWLHQESRSICIEMDLKN